MDHDVFYGPQRQTRFLQAHSYFNVIHLEQLVEEELVLLPVRSLQRNEGVEGVLRIVIEPQLALYCLFDLGNEVRWLLLIPHDFVAEGIQFLAAEGRDEDRHAKASRRFILLRIRDHHHI